MAYKFHGIFFLFVSVFFTFIGCSDGEKSMGSFSIITIKDLIKCDTLQPNHWYWYEAPILRGDDAMLDRINKDNPLLAREDSPLIDIKNYTSRTLRTQWDGMAFTQNVHGENVVINKITLLHRKYELTDELQLNIIDKLKDTTIEREGIYYFKDDPEQHGALKEVSLGDLPFLRSYYAITAEDQHLGVVMLKSTISQYIIYDYYPSGRIRTVVILNAFWDNDSALKNVYINKHPFADRPHLPASLKFGKSSHQAGETKTKITDPNHYYWLEKLLKE